MRGQLVQVRWEVALAQGSESRVVRLVSEKGKDVDGIVGS